MKKLMNIAKEKGTPLFVFSSETFKQNYLKLSELLPGVKHHFALKSLPHKDCINIIHELNGYMDLATRGEIDLVLGTAPELLNHSIVTHPIKSNEDLLYFKENGIRTIVVDNISELRKILPYRNFFDVLIRIAFSNDHARFDLSKKFGTPPEEVIELIQHAMDWNINVIGCCFHVGSQMDTPDMHVNAIQSCYYLYQKIELLFNFKFKILDIGGGFPAQYHEHDISIEAFCKPIKAALDEYFSDMEVWSELGRCLTANTGISVTKVVGKTIKNGIVWYYLDDGVYGLFSAKFFDYAQFIPSPIVSRNNFVTRSVLSGPTCDSIDVIAEDVLLPEMEIGDYMYCKIMGAYTWATRTDFNLCNPINWIDQELISTSKAPVLL